MSSAFPAQDDTRNVDLHSHSTASDGAVSPADVVAAAERVGLGAIALTDHDTIAGLPEAVAAGARLGVRVVPGCELSAYDGDFEIHLLALHISDWDAIGPSLTQFQHERVERAQAMVDRLVRLGVPVSMQSVLGAAAGGAVGRPHVARALIDGGHVVDHREAFDRYLGNGRPAYVPKPRFAVADAIALAHSAGALAIWAHPSREGSRTRVERLAGLGMDGVEVRHPSHSPLDVERLRALVVEFELVPSGGSDWHGATEGYRTLGNMQIPAAWLAQQDARVAARAA
ncbi:MAG: PHP domain-containing protein [Gemmatimonadaceae bacterium]